MRNFLKNLSLKTKLTANAGILLILLTLSSTYAIYSMSKIGNELSAIAGHDIPLTQKITQITIHQLEQAIQFERVRHYGAILQQEDMTTANFSNAIKAFNEGSEQVEAEILEAETIIAAAMKVAAEDMLKKFKSVNNRLSSIKVKHQEYVEHAQGVFDAITQGKKHVVEQLAEKVEHEEDMLDKELVSILSSIAKFTASSSINAKDHERAATNILSFITLGSIIFGIIVSWLVSGFILKAIHRAMAMASIIASGDLTQSIKVDSKDEIGQLLTTLNSMQQKLIDMLSHISGTTTQLSTASEEMSVITAQTSRAIQQQQLETEQVATAMNEMTATVQEVAGNTNNTASAVCEANDHTENGRKVVEQTVEQINKLAEQIKHTLETIQNLEQYSEDINSVMDVINGIAEQTNLLALNAAIEAARAGEQGRGFAVVADEVRNLASRTQESTQEINQMIEKLQSGSRQAVQAMQESQEQASTAVVFATQSGTALETIAEAVIRINDMSTQIACAAEEQGAVSEEINGNIIQINEITHQTANGAEETSAASKDLARMAAELQGLVAKFTV